MTMSQVIMGNGAFYNFLSQNHKVLECGGKKQQQMYLFFLSHSLLLNHLEPQSNIKTKLLLPIMPIGIVVYAFTLLWVGE